MLLCSTQSVAMVTKAGVVKCLEKLKLFTPLSPDFKNTEINKGIIYSRLINNTGFFKNIFGWVTSVGDSAPFHKLFTFVNNKFI